MIYKITRINNKNKTCNFLTKDYNEAVIKQNKTNWNLILIK